MCMDGEDPRQSGGVTEGPCGGAGRGHPERPCSRHGAARRGPACGAGCSGDAPGSAQKDPRGGGWAGAHRDQGTHRDHPCDTPACWPRGPGCLKRQGLGDTWRSPSPGLRPNRVGILMGVYGETPPPPPPGRDGTGHMLQPPSRDEQGSTHTLKWGRGTWKGAAGGQGCPNDDPSAEHMDSGAHGAGEEGGGQKEKWGRQRCAGGGKYTAELPSPKGGGQGSLSERGVLGGGAQG